TSDPSAGDPAPASGKADAFGWCHGSLAADAGVTVGLDFQARFHDSQATADPFWINVYNSNHGAGTDARAVIVEKSYAVRGGHGGDCPSFQGPTHQIDLTYDAEFDRFTGNVHAGLPINDDRSTDNPSAFFWEVAVVVGGEWFKNGDSNLVFNPSDDGDIQGC